MTRKSARPQPQPRDRVRQGQSRNSARTQTALATETDADRLLLDELWRQAEQMLPNSLPVTARTASNKSSRPNAPTVPVPVPVTDDEDLDMPSAFITPGSDLPTADDLELEDRDDQARDRELEMRIMLAICKRTIQVTRRIVATAAAGVVTITGAVSSLTEKQRTLDLIHRLPGVRDVVDHLQIAAPEQDARPTLRQRLRHILQRVRLAPAIAVALIVAGGFLFATRGTAAKIVLPNLYPVHGTVRYEGWIPAGAVVVLHPVQQSGQALQAFGKVREDGSFRVTTHREDGAPAGEYTVTFELRKMIQDQSGVRFGPNIFPDRYASPNTSPVKIVVLDGRQNELQPMEIKR